MLTKGTHGAPPTHPTPRDGAEVFLLRQMGICWDQAASSVLSGSMVPLASYGAAFIEANRATKLSDIRAE